MLKDILRSKLNAYGVLVVAGLWAMIAAVNLITKAANLWLEPVDVFYNIIALAVLFVYFYAVRKEPGLAGAGLAVGLLSALANPQVSNSFFNFTGNSLFLGVSFLLFAFPLLRRDELHHKLLGWVLIGSGAFNVAFTMLGRSGEGLLYVVGAFMYLLQAGLAIMTIYYIFMESCLNETK